jgi:hypothetical protein
MWACIGKQLPLNKTAQTGVQIRTYLKNKIIKKTDNPVS